MPIGLATETATESLTDGEGSQLGPAGPTNGRAGRDGERFIKLFETRCRLNLMNSLFLELCI